MGISYTEKTVENIGLHKLYVNISKNTKKSCCLINLFVYAFIIFYQARHSKNQ